MPAVPLKIPKVIHRIWLGGAEMPPEYVRFGESWREHHPEWEMRLWTDADPPPMTHPEGFARCRNFGEASDVLRYEILSRFGGVYVDTDVQCLRSLDPLIEDASAFAAYARPGLIGSAVVGSVANHPAMLAALEVVAAGAGSGSQVEATGPVALTSVLKDAADVELFGRETFYPLDYWEIPFADDLESEIRGAYAIHHWHATWQTREALMLRTRQLMLRTREIKKRERRRRQRFERQIAQRDKRLEAALARQRRLKERLARIQNSPSWRFRNRLKRMTSFGRRGRKRP